MQKHESRRETWRAIVWKRLWETSGFCICVEDGAPRPMELSSTIGSPRRYDAASPPRAPISKSAIGCDFPIPSQEGAAWPFQRLSFAFRT